MGTPGIDGCISQMNKVNLIKVYLMPVAWTFEILWHFESLAASAPTKDQAFLFFFFQGRHGQHQVTQNDNKLQKSTQLISGMFPKLFTWLTLISQFGIERSKIQYFMEHFS